MKLFKKRKQTALMMILIIVFVAAAVAILVMRNDEQPASETVQQNADTVAVTPKVYKYGIDIEPYEIRYDTVRPNQNLSHILHALGLSSQQVYTLCQHTEGVFDVRTLRDGQAYAFFTTRDSLHTPAYFVYEMNPVDYVVFHLQGDQQVVCGQNPVEWLEKRAEGQVETSLWMAMLDAHTAPQLAVELSNIFGWTIDFFSIQQGDKFRVIYEQEYVNNHPLSRFHIKAASFCASDSMYYAIPFVQDGEELYYNRDGNSLEGAFLKAPLDYYRITSRFTNSRYHPVLKRYRAHHGVDYAAPVGTPVYAIGSGKVIAKGYQANGGGNYIKVRHNSVYTTSYMHLSRFAKGLHVGQAVKQKEVIGYVGSTGLSTGPHLDFRVFENGTPINPLTIKSQPKKPISKDNRQAFSACCDSLINELNNIDLKE